jgi:transcriptional regulator with XRE-family HTH domain
MESKIGDRFRAIRRSLGLNQRDMAELVDIGARFYQDIEANKSEPSLSYTIKAAKALGMSIDALLDYSAPLPKALQEAKARRKQPAKTAAQMTPEDFANAVSKMLKPGLSKEEEELITIFRGLSDHGKSAAVSSVKGFLEIEQNKVGSPALRRRDR